MLRPKAGGYDRSVSTATPTSKPDWTQIDCVLLDMDGTLLDLRFDNFFWRELVPQRYAAHYGLSVDEAARLLHPRFAEWEGRLEWYCLDHWTRELGFDITALKHEVAERIACHPNALEFLRGVRSLRKRVALVTNASRPSLALKLERTGLADYLDACYCSHDFGLPKEVEGFWELLNAHEAFDAERTLLVDDSAPVLRAARAYGLRHLYEVRRPDSGAAPRHSGEFATVDCLQDLLPQSLASGPSGAR
jgi:putative hydrolase of the HAD superfamily